MTARDGLTCRRTLIPTCTRGGERHLRKLEESGQDGVNVVGERERDLSERGLIFLWPYTCKLKQFLPSEGQGPLSSSPVPTV